VQETKQARVSTTSTKRSRAAEVHNLSERVRLCFFLCFCNLFR